MEAAANPLALFNPAAVGTRASVDGKIVAKVNAPNDAVVASSRPDTQLWSFLISRTLEVHRPTTIEQSFNDRRDAPAGYRFANVVRVNVVSSSHVSSSLEATASEGGSAIRAVYRPESADREPVEGVDRCLRDGGSGAEGQKRWSELTTDKQRDKT